MNHEIHKQFFVGILLIIGHIKELTGRKGNMNTRVIMAVTGQVRQYDAVYFGGWVTTIFCLHLQINGR